jgi:glycosyltransferase involved in cell wall biosynthesis
MAPLRVAFFATFFPKPQNVTMGMWAMRQAQALLRNGVDLTVVSMTPWVPRFLGSTIKRAQGWANCPAEHRWGELRVLYPRWGWYPLPGLRRWDYKHPALMHAIAWRSAARRIRRIVRELNPDVIYVNHAWLSGDIARRLKKEYGIPYVVTDLDFLEITDCENYPGRRRFVARVMRDADRVVPVSRRMEADIQRIFTGTRTTVAHYGAEPIPDSIRRVPRPPELEGKKVVFSAAAFYERKGVPLLARAFGKIARKHPSAVLRIAGSGGDGPLVEKEIADAGCADQVTLLGGQPHDRVLQELVWCDLFALFGWDEPFATVYLEAFSAGKPVACCSDGGINDVLVKGVHGLAVPPRDVDAAAHALDQMLQDDASRARMAAAAKELFESRLTWDRTAQFLIEILHSVAQRKQ